MSTQTLPFHKMAASGNDFVVVDNRDKTIKDAVRFAKKICALHTGIGADGVLLLENSKKGAFKMRIINSDGSEAEACGNGFRCIALYAHQRLGFPKQFQFESVSGLISASVNKKRVCVELVKPSRYQERSAIEVLGHRLSYSFINPGVPHVVIQVEGLPKIEVESLGRSIRYHDKFQPRGTNVNFVEVKGLHKIEVRTYERGVEAETLACGTGSTASALVTSLGGYTKPPVQVRTRGGEILTIHFKMQGKNITQVILEGEAHFVFEGKLNYAI